MKKNVPHGENTPVSTTKKDKPSILQMNHGSFWFWATIRIIVVLLIIFGAFVAGLRVEQNNTMNWRLGEFSGLNMKNQFSCANGEKDRTRHSFFGNMINPALAQRNITNTCMKEMKEILNEKQSDELDRTFLENMIAHDMASIDMISPLAKAKHPELKKFGDEMIKNQKKEIEQLKKWQREWKYIQTGSTSMTGSTTKSQSGTRIMF